MKAQELLKKVRIGPIQSIEIDLNEPLPEIIPQSIDGVSYQFVLILIKCTGKILGTVKLPIPEEGLRQIALAVCLWQELSDEIKAFHKKYHLPEPNNVPVNGYQINFVIDRTKALLLESGPNVSVVVATHNRTKSLRETVNSVLNLDYPSFDLIIVDNAPATDETERYVKNELRDDPRVTYIREERPGLAAAHNKGLSIVESSIVAFTDDDVVVDPNWLTELVRGFTATENVAAVTGMIWPAELITPAQIWTEQFGGFGKGVKRRIFGFNHSDSKSPLFPYTVGEFGSGANMAFKTAALMEIGGFDTALGAGSKGMGGDDLDAFFQVITHGYDLVYEPNAIIWHWHRAEYEGLYRQAFGYGAGLTAFLTKSLLQRPNRIFFMLKKLPAAVWHLINPKSRKNQAKLADFPKELNIQERRGMLYGPLAYAKGALDNLNHAGKL